MNSARILIIIPTYNERENILPLLGRIFTLHPLVHILVVDDHSPDGTADVVREAQSRHGERLNLLVRHDKGGRGSAVLAGFRFALERDFDVICEMDADFSHRPEEIRLLLDCLRDCDMVVGSRYLPGSAIHHWGWWRRVFSCAANRFARIILGIPITDYTNGFRCYTRCAVKALNMDCIEAKGYVVLSEIAYQLFLKGMRICEVPTMFPNRRRGLSNLRFHEIREAFLSVLRLRLRYRR